MTFSDEELNRPLNVHAEVRKDWAPSYADFAADFADYCRAVRDWCEASDLLKAVEARDGYSQDIPNVTERDIYGHTHHWLQGLYFARGLHEMVADYYLAKPFWDYESRETPAHNEFTARLMRQSDGIPLEHYRQSFDALATDGRPDLAIRIWRHVFETEAARSEAGAASDQDAQLHRLALIEIFDLLKPVVAEYGSEVDQRWLSDAWARLPDSPFADSPE